MDLPSARYLRDAAIFGRPYDRPKSPIPFSDCCTYNMAAFPTTLGEVLAPTAGKPDAVFPLA